MAEILFITPQEMTETSIMGGNVDIDKYVFCIANTQVTYIEPLLGSLLYDKIIDDLENDTLSGLYLTLFNEFVKPITKHKSIGEYIEISSYMLTNGGLYKHSPENAEIVDKDEAQYLSNKYDGMAQMYIQRFQKWICKNHLVEYQQYQDEVNASKDVKATGGWYFGRTEPLKWYLDEKKETNE